MVVCHVNGTERPETFVQDLTFLLSYLLILLVQKLVSRSESAGENAPTLKLLGIYYAVHVLSMTVLACGYANTWITTADHVLLTVRVCVVSCVLQKRWIILGCLVYSSLYLGRVYTVDVTLVPAALVRQFMFAGFLLLASELCRRCIVRQARATQEAQTLQHATERLLDLLCDAIAHVDWDLRFTSHPAKLAATLFLGRHRDLTGSRLEALLEETCERRVQTILRSAARSVGPAAGAFNLLMRDSLGNAIGLEAFYIHFSQFGKHRYLLGFRECVDDCPRAAPLVQDLPQPVEQQVQKLRGQVPLAPITLHSTWLDDGSSQNDSSRRSDRPRDENPELADTASSSQPTETGVKFILPYRRPTDPGLVKEGLLELSRSFNYIKPLFEPCCSYHGALEALSAELENLKLLTCRSTFRLHTQWQCRACGMMGPSAPSDGNCWFCHDSVASAPAVSSSALVGARGQPARQQPGPTALGALGDIEL
eukprot:TRINITY_DN12609_c0_g1_i1.p1 TRINITY_DN12609_c0_g1~~TRINITY_DN12609_c0_g1_i1.p1  ORF type:complete len:481 (+),score=46.91 TRINITY_DN12609_c0_g1_i1:627-2069(+)